MRIDEPRHLDGLDFTKSGGLVPVIAQHARTGVVLMVAFADRVALERSLRDRRMWYYSRSRGAHWLKGETSGNTQHIVSLHADCDADSVLALVEPAGPACHTGEWSCFPTRPALPALADVIALRAQERPRGSHTTRLMDDENLRLKKLGEEAVELALACHSGDPAAVAEEAADLLYHMLVACTAAGVGLEDVLGVVAARRGRGLLLPPDEQTVERKEHDRAEYRDQ